MRHVEVEQHEVEPAAVRAVERDGLGAVAREEHAQAHRREHAGGHLRDRRLVVHDEHRRVAPHTRCRAGAGAAGAAVSRPGAAR
jgi:hypothetical protein